MSEDARRKPAARRAGQIADLDWQNEIWNPQI